MAPFFIFIIDITIIIIIIIIITIIITIIIIIMFITIPCTTNGSLNVDRYPCTPVTAKTETYSPSGPEKTSPVLAPHLQIVRNRPAGTPAPVDSANTYHQVRTYVHYGIHCYLSVVMEGIMSYHANCITEHYVITLDLILVTALCFKQSAEA
jgi:hypothetical protein